MPIAKVPFVIKGSFILHDEQSTFFFFLLREGEIAKENKLSSSQSVFSFKSSCREHQCWQSEPRLQNNCLIEVNL